MNKILKISALTISILTISYAQSGTLEDVKKRGQVVCGAIQGGLAGFSLPDM